MSIERHDSHPPEVICRPAGNGLCERLSIPEDEMLAATAEAQAVFTGDEGPEFSAGI